MIGRDELEAARKTIAPVIRATPVVATNSLSELLQREILLKPEQLQRTGSFKLRGAYNFLSSIGAGPGTEVVAASAGNHAQGVALAARLRGAKATIFMPTAASLPKVQATEHYGATVRLQGDLVDDCIAAAQEHARRSGAIYVPPFDDPLVIAGQGTIGLELAEEAPEAETVVVPVGGGGLIAGVAAAFRALGASTRIVGVQASGCAAMAASVEAKEVVSLQSVSTMADGIAVRSPSQLTLDHVLAYVDDVVTVSEEDISRALVLLLERAKTVVEPAAAASLAALMSGAVPGTGQAVAILSGGNVDPLLLTKLIEHGLSAAGRYLILRVLLEDRPGMLAALAQELAKMRLNVLDVSHHRAGLVLGHDEVEVLLTVETRGRSHGEAVIERLAAAGFTVSPLR